MKPHILSKVLIHRKLADERFPEHRHRFGEL
jgi:hypothetical protein